MDDDQKQPQDLVRSGINPPVSGGKGTTRRQYAPPKVDRRVMPSVVKGGPSGRVEQHPHQGHKRP